ncbi:hypothetical protein [Cryobacterium gelidum]|uniref:WxL domain-containing protein n=1 Tax=Cryobacterium gelidum TaxID=1259164 RepID=A0A4R9AYN3_9MICO|nr:hypothetical protein [Cryobacterium gelidum]TFD72657.1 hypothetical protein E3T50_04855 [Cryobacterium gelidum]
MMLSKNTKFIAIGAVTIALVSGAGVSSSYAVVAQANGSDAPLYVYDANVALVTDPAVVFTWAGDNLGAGTDAGYDTPSYCPAGTTGASTFLATVGNERTVGNFAAKSVALFNPNPAVAGTKELIAVNLTPQNMTAGTPGQAAVKAAGGKYNLGFACTTNSGVTVVKSTYRTINITPGTGNYTIEALTAEAPAPAPAPAGTSGDVALAPTTTAASNGVLALTVPAGAAASFGTPSLVNNKSTTIGTLGNITVNDGRGVTREGWNLSATVADFKNNADPTNIISKSQLGVAPKLVAAGTSATGVTAAAAQVAGAALGTYAFALGSAANTVGDTVLNADLTFVAPQDKAAGTYTSTMTLTVVSK